MGKFEITDDSYGILDYDKERRWRWVLFDKEGVLLGKNYRPFRTRRTAISNIRNILQFFNYDKTKGGDRLVFDVSQGFSQFWDWKLELKNINRILAIGGQRTKTKTLCHRQTELFAQACKGALIAKKKQGVKG